MRKLHLDIETFSSEPIDKVGAYKYILSNDFTILLVCYAYDDDPVKCIDLAQGEQLPPQLVSDILDPNVIKFAHNAVFERVAFSVFIGRRLGWAPFKFIDPSSWRCTAVLAARCGYPLSLKEAGAAMGLDKQKMAEGEELIRLFCTPRKTTQSAGLFGALPPRVAPSERPEDWKTFKAYCVRDVETERGIEQECSWYEVSDFENRLYATDQAINDRGVRIDTTLALAASNMDAIVKAHLSVLARKLTGLNNPNSKPQLKTWLGSQLGIVIDSLNKKNLPDIVKAAQGHPLVLQVLDISAMMGKTSNAKYGAMLGAMCDDGRVRGLTQFYGTRTGRWAGRLVQMQNLPQNHIKALDKARSIVRDGDYETAELCFGNVPDTLSQLIRTAFVPAAGKHFAVCDFSAIEARVLAWVAGEDWVLDVFRSGGDIYCATASQMFHKPVEKHGQNAELRQRGKVSVLALGYQGAEGALEAMGASRLGMTAQEKSETVTKWRAANPNIVALWGALENAARNCVIGKVHQEVHTPNCVISFDYQENGTMTITLPSGRMICYPQMEWTSKGSTRWETTGMTEGQAFSNAVKGTNYSTHRKAERLRFMGVNQETHKWEWIDTYGGKLTENIIQAIGRDCLAEDMLKVEAAGYGIVFHVHDELVMEVNSVEDLKDIERIFAEVPSWAKGLPLKGAGYTGEYYYKD